MKPSKTLRARTVPRTREEPKPFYELRAQAGQPVELFLYGEIGTWFNSARELIAKLEPYRDQKIQVRINSIGGDVFEGTAIANFLKTLDAEAVIDGMCASIATRIALACKTVKIPPSAFMAIHNCWDYVAGNANDLLKIAGNMKKVDATMRQEYMAKTGDDEETITAEMDAETWFDGATAVERGFADELIEDVAPETVQASLRQFSDTDFSRFAHLPSVIRGSRDRGTPPQPKPQKPPGPADAGPKQTMEKLLAAIVAAGLIPSAKLDDETAASLFKAEFDKLKSRVETAEKEKTDLQAKLDKSATDAAKQAAESAVEEAVKAGKIANEPELRGRWVQAYLKDQDGTKAMLKGMTGTPPKPAHGAPPVTETPDDQLEDLDSLRAAMAKETDPEKKYALGLKARKLRGHESLFSDAK